MNYVLTCYFATLPATLLAAPIITTESQLVSESQAELRSQANQLMEQGVEQHRAGKGVTAISLWKKALAAYQKIGDLPGEGVVLRNLGAAYAIQRDHHRAIQHLQMSLVIAKELGDRQQQEQILRILSSVVFANKDYVKALEYRQKHLWLARKSSNDQAELIALQGLGQVYKALNNHQLAIQYFQELLALSQKLENKTVETEALINLGLAHYDQRNYTKAIEVHRLSLEIAQNQGNQKAEVRTLGNLGITYRAIGQFSKAIDYHLKALNLQKNLNGLQVKHQIFRNLGNAYAMIGDYDRALFRQHESLETARKIRDNRGIGRAYASLGATYANKGDYKKAIFNYKKSLDIVKRIGDLKAKGYTLLNLGLAHHVQQDFSKAKEEYLKTLQIASDIGDRWLEAKALTSLGFAFESEELDQAIAYYKKGLAIFNAIGSRQEEARTLNNRAHTFLGQGKYLEAEKDLRQAINILDDLRNNLDDFSQVSIFDTQVTTYNLLQQVLISQNQKEAALEISEQGRARAFTNLLSERQNPNSTKTLSTARLSIEEIRQIARRQKITVVEYSIVPEDDYIHQGKQLGEGGKLYIWVVQPTGNLIFRAIDLKERNVKLSALVENSISGFGIRNRGGGFENVDSSSVQSNNLQNLHKILIEPIASFLPDNPEDLVVLVPQSELFLIPFPALKDKAGSYLIQKHTIQTAPSIQILDLIQRQTYPNKKNTVLGEDEILVVGNPVMPKVWNSGKKSNHQLSDLPGAEKEAIAIAKLLNTKALTNSQATEPKVKQLMPDARVIHLATHGLLEYGKPEESGIQDIPGAIALAPFGQVKGLLTASEILQLNLNAPLVVLSACDTGLGDITGDGVIGLSRSFIAAGSSSVIVSLWSIPDMPTAQLMTEFYRQWHQNGLDKAQALRQAMLKTMKDNPEPAKWAAFTLIGSAQ